MPLVDRRPPSATARSQEAALHTGCLILTPADPHLAPDVRLIIEGLGRAGLVGSPQPSSAEGWGFSLGPSFLSLLSFTGCAVQLPEHPDKGDWAPIRLLPPSPYPRLLVGRNTRPPRCPSCRAQLSNWRDLVEHWVTHPHAGVSCPGCGEMRPPWLWDWKQQGGFGRLFVRIEEVFPREATPTPALFEHLIRISGASWCHFYLQE
ncbi:hypothetical protein GWK36_09750 [Caldichromatium japonicum]|uniref:C2H2-type domain-containing protein n=1 Tax=Caldichromatium japonicum TaxID=2699430 RepID=A0A6G7VGR7_9GAMM|nr:hypothetical protein GWK36_09750 [Caldichromatium japonicum]